MGKKRRDNSGPRDYLTEEESIRLAKSAGSIGRHRHRDSTMILLAFRHGLRASELVGLRRDQVDLDKKIFHVRRLKGGTPSVHPLSGQEVRDLRRVIRESPDPESRFVWVGERGSFSRRAFQLIVERAGKIAGIPLDVHPHMLRHACGHWLANKGEDTRAIQGWLGHTNITMTMRYTTLREDRFKRMWGDD